MKHVFLGFFSILFIAKLNAQDCEINCSIMFRNDQMSEKKFTNLEMNNEIHYFKSNIKDSPKIYSIVISEDCMIAKIKFTVYKNGVEVNNRELSFSKEDANNVFHYDQNALMGPYMKPQGEDEVRIEATIYKKTEDGYRKISSENSTFSIKLDLESEFLADNE